jgi:dipeptidyl aminopeptidase/acylaminoacyl peptidase
MLVSTASAQQKRAMTFEDVLALKGVADAQISPDGKWIAYTVSSVDMKDNAVDSDIWLVATSGGSPIRLTTNKKSDSQPRWSPDGKKLAFISAREERPQIFLISPFGGESERVTEAKTGVQSFQWSPDGRQIAFIAQQEMTPEEEKKQKDRDDAIVVDKNFKFARLWVIDVQTKKASELVKNDYVVNDPQWSPDGNSIAYVTNPTPKADDGSLTDIYIIDVKSGRQRKLLENDGPDTSPRWSPDGRRIAFLSREPRLGAFGQSRLMMISAEGGSPREVAQAFLYQPGAVIWSKDGNTLYFNSSVRTTSQLFSVPSSGGEVKQLSKVEGLMGPTTFSRDESTIAFVRSDLQNPADVCVAKLPDTHDGVKLTDHNPQVRGFALGAGEVIKWKSKDGMETDGVLIRPVGYQAGRRYPTIALIHGGPAGVWTQGFPGSWNNFGHIYAGRGWAVFYPNVRGSSGYGEKSLLSNVRDWGGGDYQDIQSGLDNLIAMGLADSDRLAQAGWSYGGYMTAWTLTQTNRFKAVMVGAGLTNMYSMYSTNDIPRVLDGYFGAEPWDDFDIYWKRSAMAFIKQAKTPTLILHGAEDKRVPVGQAQELYAGLRKNDVPVELVFYPRQGHGILEPRLQLDKMRREYAWFSKYVLGLEVKDDMKTDEKPSGNK